MANAIESQSLASDQLDLAQVRIDPVWALRVPSQFALRKTVLPLCLLNETVLVASPNSVDPRTTRALESYLKHPVQMVTATSDSFRRAIKQVYDRPTISDDLQNRNPAGAIEPTSPRRPAHESDDAVALCDEILQAASLRGASDIHVVPSASTLIVQMRVDGQLEQYRMLPMSVHSSLTSRLKVLAGLDIAERRAPQDGRMAIRKSASARKIDIRVATLPTQYGERVTLRLLTAPGGQLTLSSLGMRGEELKAFESATARPHGLILLNGPTGSGKSTTLYVAIDQLIRRQGGNVITIEDPIEYEIEGASQVEVDSADKVNFSKALRSLLRHDPDVVMIGEIRDQETASIAVKASLTGHLVFSTLHTNTAAGVVTRLADLGVEPFLIAATLRLSVAQRLVRRLCSHCRIPRDMTRTEAIAVGETELTSRTVYEPAGCVRCAGRGYVGRIALFEMLAGSEELAGHISSGATEEALIAFSKQHALRRLRDDGLAKILDGTTTVDEVVRAVSEW